MSTKIKKLLFIFLSLMLFLVLLEIVSYFLVNFINNHPLIKKAKNYYNLELAQNELKVYNNLIPYINGSSISKLILESKDVFDETMFYETFSKFKKENNENILLQGDSWAHTANLKKIKEKLTILAKKNNWGLINGGTISYSVSPITVQLDIITKKFKKKPSIIIAIIDQTDFGDELHRYQSLNLKDLSLQDTQIHNEFKQSFVSIIDSNRMNSIKIFCMFKEFYSSRYSQFNRNHVATIGYVFKRVFYLSTNTLTVLAPLKYGLKDQERKLLAHRFDKYINKAFKTGIKQLIFVTHPHKNHLTKKIYYKEEMGAFLENIIKNSSYKKNILHVDFKKNFRKIYSGYDLEKIFLQNDVSSHLTVSAYDNVFFPYVISKVSD
jgi:hypothetical protein